MQRCLLLSAAILALAGCNSPTKTAEKVAEDDYVTVEVTGSNIPKRVRKSDIKNGTLPKDVQAQLVEKDKFIQQMMPGRVVEKGN